jgi:hypothetical protein
MWPKMAIKHDPEDAPIIWTWSSLLANFRLVFFVVCIGGIMVETIRTVLG